MIVLSEYCCSGVARGTDPAGGVVDRLIDKGWAMLAAVADDLRLAGREFVVPMDTALRRDPYRERWQYWPGVVWCEPGEAAAVWRALVKPQRAALIIAPEFDGILAGQARIAAECGCDLLGPSADVIEAVSSKARLAVRGRREGLPVPETMAGDSTGWRIIKPAVGAGAVDTYAVAPGEPLPILSRECVVQPLIRGTPASVAFLCGGPEPVALPPTRQLLDGCDPTVPGPSIRPIRYRGGELPLPAPFTERAIALGRRALAGLAGLRGFFGVDVVLGDDPAGDTIIEINPRICTSYAGLRHACATNLADALVRACAGEIVCIVPHPGHWRFDSSGRVEFADNG